MRSSSRALVASVPAAAIAVAVACGGATFEAGSPIDGGGAPTLDQGAPGQDGAQSVVDAKGSDDGGEDVESDDAGTEEASSEAGHDASDGAAQPFACATEDASTTLFCADFDHVVTVSTGWSVPLAVAGGVNAFDTTDYRSPPNGYEATTPALTDKASFAALQENLSTSASLDFSFMMLMKQIDPTATATLASIGFGTAGSTLTFDLVITANALTLRQTLPLEDGGEITQSDSVGGIGTTAWTHVQIIVGRTTTPWTIVVMRDAATKLSTNAIAAPSDPGAEISVGVVFVQPPSTGYAAAFDDVLLQTR